MNNRKRFIRDQGLTSIEVISGFAKGKIELPNLPKEITKDEYTTYCSMFIHDGALMVCGGGANNYDTSYDRNEPWKCFQLDNGIWKEHSTLNRKRANSAIVTTKKGTFIFGGNQKQFCKTYEYLPTGSTKWKNGKRSQLPGGVWRGCAIEVKSKQEIWLLGGHPRKERILSFDVNSHTSTELPFALLNERESFACAFIPGTDKIIVTGGISDFKHQSSCEIIDTKDGTVTMASPMNYRRCGHGMGIIKNNREERLAVLGGTQGYGKVHDSIELYNIKTLKWELAEDLEMDIPRCSFGFTNI